MPLPDPNPHQFVPQGDVALDPTPLQVKTPKGLRERIKKIPNWQEKLRGKLLEWVEQWEHNKQD
jgi:hypothetical protein